MFWTDKYNFVITELNKVYQSIKGIQLAIGLKDNPDSGTIYKRLDDLEGSSGGSGGSGNCDDCIDSIANLACSIFRNSANINRVSLLGINDVYD